MFTATIAFYGAARVACFEGETPALALNKALAAVDMAAAGDAGQQLAQWAAAFMLDPPGRYSGASAQHGYLGLSYRAGPHDPWLDSVTADYPACPWLDYSQSAQALRAAAMAAA